MLLIDPGVRRRRQPDEALPQLGRRAVRRRASAVAVDQSGQTLRAVSRQEASDLADRKVQDTGRLVHRDPSHAEVLEDIEALLRSGITVIVSSLSMGSRVTKSLAAYGVTYSLAEDTPWAPHLSASK